MAAMRDALTSDEWSVARSLANDGEPADFAALDQLDEPRKVAVLDTAYEHLKYRTAGDDEVPAEDQALERKLLLTRGKLGITSVPPKVVPGPPPDGRPLGAPWGVSQAPVPQEDEYWSHSNADWAEALQRMEEGALSRMFRLWSEPRSS